MGSSTPNPWARGNRTLSDVVKARKDDTAQHRRQTSRYVPPKPATPGSMQGFTRAKPGSTSWSVQGPTMRDWTFNSTVDDSPYDKPALQLGGGGAYFGPTEAGHYSTRIQIQFTVTGTPTAVLAQAHVNSLTLTAYTEEWLHADFNGYWRGSWWSGPFWCDGTSTPLGLQAVLYGSGLSAGTVLPITEIDVWRVG